MISLHFRFSLNHISNVTFLLISSWLTWISEVLLKEWSHPVRQQLALVASGQERGVVSAQCLAVTSIPLLLLFIWMCFFSQSPYLVGSLEPQSWNIIWILQILILEYQRWGEPWKFLSNFVFRLSASLLLPLNICLNVAVFFSPLRHQKDIFWRQAKMFGVLSS